MDSFPHGGFISERHNFVMLRSDGRHGLPSLNSYKLFYMPGATQPVTQASLKIRLARKLLLLFVSAVCAGCLMPIRAPTKIQTTEGKGLKKTVDLSFIQPGKSTREEVESRLGWIATGVKDDRFTLGRWAESKWGVVWAVGGYYAGAGGWNRYWKIHNLVIDFDEREVVEQFSQIPSEKLLQVLMERVRRDPSHPLDLSVPIEIPVEYVTFGQTTPGKLVLGPDDFAFVWDKNPIPKKKNQKSEPFKYQTAPDNISNLLSVNRGEVEADHPQFWAVRIEFKRPVARGVGKRMDVKIDLPSTLTLIRYFVQIQSGSQARVARPNRSAI
jgi:hypothetical protein